MKSLPSLKREPHMMSDILPLFDTCFTFSSAVPLVQGVCPEFVLWAQIVCFCHYHCRCHCHNSTHDAAAVQKYVVPVALFSAFTRRKILHTRLAQL